MYLFKALILNRCMNINCDKLPKVDKDFLVQFGNLLLEEKIFLEKRKLLFNKLLTNINPIIKLQKDQEIEPFQEQFDATLQNYATLLALSQVQTKPVKELKEEKLRKEIYEKVKNSGVKASRKSLMDMGYTEAQLRPIKIKMINFEIFGK